jgi:hypothetical protein
MDQSSLIYASTCYADGTGVVSAMAKCVWTVGSNPATLGEIATRVLVRSGGDQVVDRRVELFYK